MRLSLSCSSLLLASLGTGSFAGVVKRAAPDRSNVVENSKIKDPNQECSGYWYPPSDNYLKNFPPSWEIAKIVSGDTAATDAYNAIKSKIVNSPLKGQNGVFTATSSYNTGADPDCWWTTTGCVTPKASNVPADIAKIPEPMSIGYGFDDGPNCSHNAFYDYLQEKNQKATMFFVGSNVINWPLEAQRALYDGHEMCAHSWSHNAMTTLTNEQAFAEIQSIKAVTGVTPTCWRPPYGDTDDRIRSIVAALGLSTILWQYDSNDWMGGSQVDGYYNDFINRGKNGEFNQVGTIFLQHETNEYTMGKAMEYYPAMKSAFKYLVPVAVALNKTNPYVEKNVEFPTFNEYISGTVQKPLPASALSFLGVTATSTTASPTFTSTSVTSSTMSSAVSSSTSSSASSSSVASSSSSIASFTSSRASSSSSASSTSSRASSTTLASSSSAAPANTGVPSLPAKPTQEQWGTALKAIQNYMGSLLSLFGKWKR